MTRIAIKRHALRLFWPLGSGREFILPLFAVGQLCKWPNPVRTFKRPAQPGEWMHH